MKPEELIAHLKGFKSPSKQQQMLLELAGKTERTKDEERKLAVLMKAELSARKALEAKSKVKAIFRTEEKQRAAEERKARNHRLILQGTLFDLAGMGDWSRGEMMGALLAVAKSGQEAGRRQAWKQAGDALLAEKEASRE